MRRKKIIIKCSKRLSDGDLFINCNRTEWSPIRSVIIHSIHCLFSDWPKTYCEFSKSAPRASFSYRLYNDTITMSRTFKVTGNHVTYDRGA